MLVDYPQQSKETLSRLEGERVQSDNRALDMTTECVCQREIPDKSRCRRECIALRFGEQTGRNYMLSMEKEEKEETEEGDRGGREDEEQ